MTGLESEICKFIQDKYKVCFTGILKVIQDDNEYCLQLFLNNDTIPVWICSEHSDDESFLKYIKKEIVRRNLIDVKFYKLKLENGKNRSHK